ncbi:MAG: SPOR domain-containing protein [Rubrivivax sp.]|nr:SPOR domain-containing protein [Rubrivivax sp.]
MRLPFLRPKPETEPARPAAKRAERARSVPEGGELGAARARARRRLMGALVLLVVGVVGFPMLFETQPRPLPLDIPIELPAGAGRVMPPAPPSGRPLPVLSVPSDAGNEVAVAEAALPVPVTPQAAAPAPVASAAVKPASVKAASEPRKAAAAPSASAAKAPAPKASAAPATIAPKAAAAKASAPVQATAPAAEGRFVVQVGAYTDAATLRAARAKVEKLGLKTYTQVIEGDAGKRTRVRLGPYATRGEADAAADKLKGAGLPANVLAL